MDLKADDITLTRLWWGDHIPGGMLKRWRDTRLALTIVESRCTLPRPYLAIGSVERRLNTDF